MRRDFQLKLTLLLIAGLPACGGDGSGNDGGTPPSTIAIAKSSSSGDAQTGVVGQPLANPIQVVVTDAGAAAAGVTVNWSTSAAGGLLAATSVTDANGLASNTWTLGTLAGPQSAQASLSGASGSPVGFSATATAGPAAALEEAGGNGQTATVGTQLAAPVQAQVSDEFGNGVSGVAVDWAATNGTVSAPSVTSDASGISSVNVTAGSTPGPITITARSGALAGSPVTFTATAAPVGSGSSTVSVLNNQFSPENLTVAAGTTVVWNWPAGSFNHNVAPDGTQPARSGNPMNGPASYQFTFNTPGVYTYHCEVHQNLGMTGTITVQ